MTMLAVAMLAACGGSTKPAAKSPTPEPKAQPDDRELFPISTPQLLDAERESDAAAREHQSRAVLKSLAEEHSLKADSDAAYVRLQTRTRIALDTALAGQGKSIEVLADLAAAPLECPEVPKRVHDACTDLLGATMTALPNAVDRHGRVMQIDPAIVLDETIEPDAMTSFAKKVAGKVGTVVQRAKITKANKTALEIVGATHLRFQLDSAAPATSGIVWVAFDARSLKKTNAGWVATASVLRVEP